MVFKIILFTANILNKSIPFINTFVLIIIAIC